MSKNVTVYTTPTCPYCVMVKKFLTEKQIPFQEVDLTRSPESVDKVMRATGQLGVPQTEINGQWVIGYDPSRILSIVNQ